MERRVGHLLRELAGNEKTVLEQITEFAGPRQPTFPNLDAVKQLYELGPEASPYLREALRDRNDLVRVAAGTVLTARGEAAREVESAMIDILEDEDSLWRGSAARVLGRIKPASRAAITALLTALEDSRVRVRVVFAIRDLEPPATKAIPVLEDVAERSARSTRDAISEAIQDIRRRAGNRKRAPGKWGP